MLVIVFEKINSIFSNFKYSKIFFLEIVLLSIIFIFISSILFHITFQKLLILILIAVLFNAIILNIIGLKRKREIEEIKSVIKSIRKNKITSVDSIKLSKSLSDLEGNIKAMLKRTQKDTSNMEKLAEARSDFLGYVSHEIRTPIFTIKGYLETLMNGAIDDPKVNRAFIKKAIHHSDNLNNLLNNLIDISMIESGQLNLSFRFFNLFNFLDEIISEFIQSGLKDNIEIILHDFSKNTEVFGDKEKLKQVFVNLIGNAIKYTEEGKVDISIVDKNKSVLIKIKDTGLGIGEKEMQRIFERFFRSERERLNSIPGSGLGLSIVKHILEAHNSTISVKSRIGKGSEFSFKLYKE